MESSKLRFLILALGILFVAAIYLWERYKSAHAQHLRRKKAQRKIEYREGRDSLHHSGGNDDNPEVVVVREEQHPSPAEVKQPPGDISQLEKVKIERPAQPQEILSLSVASRRKFFTGDAIVSAMHAADLSPGPMDIYYRYNGAEQLFAVVSMVNPGTFPQDMSRFRSPGLSLIATLPGSLDGEEILEAMYETAQLLAEKLDGVLLGVDHKPLTEETLDEMRARAGSNTGRWRQG
jgi:FtsZ-interacting cell division protein ZipA